MAGSPRVGRHADRHPREEPDRSGRWLVPDGRGANLDSTGTRPRKRFDETGRTDRAREIPVDDADFARLDRSRDGVLTAIDFDFHIHAPAPSAGALLFSRTDRDANGKVTREDLDAFFRAMDGGSHGFLSLSDLQRRSRSPRDPRRIQVGIEGDARPEPFPAGAGSLQPGPKLMSRRLTSLSRRSTASESSRSRSSSARGRSSSSSAISPAARSAARPATSRNSIGGTRTAPTFAMIYVREAHPTDGWVAESNERAGISLRQPRSYEERAGVAQTCSRVLGLGMPMLVDTIDDKVGGPYSGMPSRLYLIDSRGKSPTRVGAGRSASSRPSSSTR